MLNSALDISPAIGCTFMGYVYCSFPRVLPTGPSYFHDRMGFNVTIKLLNMGVHGMGVSVGAVVVDDEEEDDEEEEEEEEEEVEVEEK